MTLLTPLQRAYAERAFLWSDIKEFMPLLYDFARLCENARVLELGTRRGNSTLAFLAGAEESGGHVWSNDIDDVTADPNGMKAWADCGLWTFIHGDDMDPQVQARLPQEVDVLFIDTSHEYGHTVKEIETFLPRVAAGGVALFHDTRWLPCRTEAEWDGSPAPVGRAIDEYCARTGRKWTEIPDNYGLGIIRL